MRFLAFGLLVVLLVPALAIARPHKKVQTNHHKMQVNHYPPPALPNTGKVTPTLKSPPASTLMLGKNDVQLEDTTLSEVRNQARRGYIQHRGDAGTSENWLCYSVPFKKYTERIWLSSGELGGSRHSITSFYAEIAGKSKETIYCPNLSPSFIPASIRLRGKAGDESFWLGSSVDDLMKLMGRPSAKIGPWLIYFYSGKVPIAGVAYDRSQLMGARINGGATTALFQSQTTTY